MAKPTEEQEKELRELVSHISGTLHLIFGEPVPHATLFLLKPKEPDNPASGGSIGTMEPDQLRELIHLMAESDPATLSVEGLIARAARSGGSENLIEALRAFKAKLNV